MRQFSSIFRWKWGCCRLCCSWTKRVIRRIFTWHGSLTKPSVQKHEKGIMIAVDNYSHPGLISKHIVSHDTITLLAVTIKKNNNSTLLTVFYLLVIAREGWCDKRFNAPENHNTLLQALRIDIGSIFGVPSNVWICIYSGNFDLIF